jgi:hypothetical protein
MNRRETLKSLLLTSSGLIALPSWASEWNAKDFTTYQSSFAVVEQQTLSSITDTIIPAGDSIGAQSVGVDKFLQKLIDNCYTEEVQANVKEQLAGLEKSAQAKYGKSFSTCDQSQREDLLLKLSTSENKNEKDFFNLIKSETIRGFNTSKEVMVKYLKYKVAPGHYYGCVDVKAS